MGTIVGRSIFAARSCLLPAFPVSVFTLLFAFNVEFIFRIGVECDAASLLWIFGAGLCGAVAMALALGGTLASASWSVGLVIASTESGQLLLAGTGFLGLEFI